MTVPITNLLGISTLQALCIFDLLRVSNLCEHRAKAAFDLKLMIGWGEHKVVLDESGFSAYRISVDWGLNFQFVIRMLHLYIIGIKIQHNSLYEM